MVVDFLGFFLSVIVILLLAPAAVFILESRTRNTGNTVSMRELDYEIDPFHVPIGLSWRRIEKLICIGKGLINQ